MTNMENLWFHQGIQSASVFKYNGWKRFWWHDKGMLETSDGEEEKSLILPKWEKWYRKNPRHMLSSFPFSFVLYLFLWHMKQRNPAQSSTHDQRIKITIFHLMRIAQPFSFSFSPQTIFYVCTFSWYIKGNERFALARNCFSIFSRPSHGKWKTKREGRETPSAGGKIEKHAKGGKRRRDRKSTSSTQNGIATRLSNGHNFGDGN